LTPPQSLEESGFKPRSTLLVPNEGRVDSVLTREEAFARVTRHSDFLGLVVRGAVPVWMPRLEPEVAGLIEGRRLTFGMARDGQVPEGARFAPIGGLERNMIARWLERMEQEFSGLVMDAVTPPAANARPADFAGQIREAQRQLAESVARAGLQRDPYRHLAVLNERCGGGGVARHQASQARG
jgi:hypothetical protein